jgi:hypothetical protein
MVVAQVPGDCASRPRSEGHALVYDRFLAVEAIGSVQNQLDIGDRATSGLSPQRLSYLLRQKWQKAVLLLLYHAVKFVGTDRIC